MKNLWILLFTGIICISSYGQIFVDKYNMGDIDGSSWATAYTAVDDALRFAKEGEEIWIAKGVYTVPRHLESFVVDKSLTIYGGFIGDEKSPEERHLNKLTTVLSGDRNQDDIPTDLVSNKTDNTAHIMIIKTDNRPVVINGITFQGGMAAFGADFGDEQGQGGAVLGHGRMIFEHCQFDNNTATFGGAVYIIPSDIPTRFTHCTFETNYAEQFGGGIYADDPYSNIIVDYCHFERNQAGKSGGGLITGSTGSQAVVANSSFFQNFANRGGGVQCDLGGDIRIYFSEFSENEAHLGGALRIQGGAHAKIEHSLFTNNRIEKYEPQEFRGGGAAHVVSGSHAAFNNCLFFENTSTGNAAAILVRDESTIHLVGNDFFANHAFFASGAIQAQRGSSVISENNIYEENSAESFVGGAIGSSTGAILESKNDQFINNSSPDGGAIYLETKTTLSVSDSYFELNGATFGGAISSVDTVDIRLSNSVFTDNGAVAGGAMYMYNGGAATIQDCEFVDNTADFAAGAIYFDQGRNSSVSGTTFTGNFSADEEGFGGAVVNRSNDLDIDLCFFAENLCVIDGGAIRSLGQVNMNVRNSDFVANAASYGGAMEFEGSGSHINIDNSTFEFNEALSGGALCVFLGASSNISNSIFSDNVGYDFGGAASFISDSDETASHFINSSKFLRNYGTRGAGAINHFDGNMTIENSLFAHNETDGFGAAFWTEDNGALQNISTLRNVTLVQNDGGEGGVLALGGEDGDRSNLMYVQNTLFANNGPDIVFGDQDARIQSNGGNLSSADISEFLNMESDIQNASPLFVNPLFGDYRLQDNSPAVNAGVDPVSNTDIDGNPRVGAPDIGAYENQNVEGSHSINKSESKNLVAELDMIISPNPVANHLKITVPESLGDDFALELIGMDGKSYGIPSGIDKNQGILEMDVFHLPVGTYLVLLTNEEGVEAKKTFAKQ